MIGGVVLVALLVVATLLPVPYVRYRPADVLNALGELDGKPIITIDGAKTYPTDGALNVTAVIEQGGPGSSLSLLQAFQGWLNAGMRLIPRDVAYPPEAFNNDDAAEERQQEGAVQMISSQQMAAIAALHYLGKPVEAVPMVESVQPGTPADGVLEPNDRLLAVNGEPVSNYADVRKAIEKVGPDQKVSVTVERDGERRTETMTTVASPDDPTQGRIGILVGIGYESPITVDISLGNVGGPSGGLMFTLSVIDKLTPGSLTGGTDIAGTGTIDPKGNVGPIGGIEQKMAGAAAAGAELFLAPGANCGEVVGHIPDGLTVTRVDTVDDAVSAIKKYNEGDTDLPMCTASAESSSP